jgi:uncharacterized protein YgiM (DUF1202 family)
MLRLKTPHRSTPLAACSVTTVVLIALVMSSAARAADNAVESKAPFPAAVKVAAAHTYLRAGPSDDFYPTERIGHGQAVEVWSVDTEGSGYCAVRPVAGSFSWIRAADVDEEAESSAEAAQGTMLTAPPMPRAIAKAPTRPMDAAAVNDMRCPSSHTLVTAVTRS